MSGSVADRLENRDREAASSLSAREIEVLREVANGKSNRQIGTDLFLSEATVKSHLVHIYNKMGVRSRTSAVAAARDAGIL